MGFRKPKKAIGLDIGSHSVKSVLMSRYGGRLRIEKAEQIMLDRDMVNNDPVTAAAAAVSDAVRTMPLQQSLVVGALAGQTVVVRYPRLTNTAPDQIENAVSREAAHNIPYDLNEVYLDWKQLDEVVGAGDQKQIKVLLVAAKHEVIEARMQILEAASVHPGVLGVDSLALADAAEACDFLHAGETVALVNIGLTSASVHFVKDGVSNFIREVNWGSREMVNAIAKDRRCSYEDAVRQLEEYQRQSAEEPVAVAADAEEVPMAQEVAEPDQAERSLLDPLDDEVDDIAPRQKGGKAGAFAVSGQIGRNIADVLSAPLTRMATEFRRSFDFYEHQLYEQPVARIVLCGGVATLPLVREALQYELGVDEIDVARPDQSALLLGPDEDVRDLLDQPAQFMVAVGLAARGMADL